jgi:hypothetical protein
MTDIPIPADGPASSTYQPASFIALELAVLVAPANKRAAVVRYAAPEIIAKPFIAADIANVAFEAHADGLLIYPAAALGLAIPALIYALTKVAATLWI